MAQALKEQQMRMARYLRDPLNEPAPEAVEERRLKVYRDLIYNNIEGFISGGFPVLRSLYSDADWHGLVRLFIDGHRCHTPYFLEISQEFLRFLMQEHAGRDCDPVFAAELAHYEWVELALDIAQESPPTPLQGDPMDSPLQLSALAWVLAYQFPVHRIGPGFTPAEAGEPVYLAVYRNRDEEVKFMELNAATARLLELAREADGGATGTELLQQLATELGLDFAGIAGFGAEQLRQFAALGLIGARV